MWHRFAFQTVTGGCQLPISIGLLLQWGIANLHRSAFQTVMGGCQLPSCLGLLLQWGIANLHRIAFQTVMGVANSHRFAFAMGGCQFA